MLVPGARIDIGFPKGQIMAEADTIKGVRACCVASCCTHVSFTRNWSMHCRLVHK